MQKKRLSKFGFLGLIAVVALGLATIGTANAQETVSYSVTIENLTSGQPFTPPVIAAHSDQLDLLDVGEAASAEVAAIAENGNADPMMTLLAASAAVADYAVGDAPVMPGGSATLSIEAPAGSSLSWISMLICTNDGFTGIDAMSLPASGSTTVDTDAYDAGSEQNTEDFADMVPPCQALVGVMSDDEGTGMSDPALAEGGVISMHAGIQGGTDLTVADHGWTDPVARVTVSVEAGGLPSSGTGLNDGSDVNMWLLFLGIGGAALVVAGGTFRFARSRASR